MERKNGKRAAAGWAIRSVQRKSLMGAEKKKAGKREELG
jgi:hypothetical protein